MSVAPPRAARVPDWQFHRTGNGLRSTPGLRIAVSKHPERARSCRFGPTRKPARIALARDAHPPTIDAPSPDARVARQPRPFRAWPRTRTLALHKARLVTRLKFRLRGTQNPGNPSNLA